MEEPDQIALLPDVRGCTVDQLLEYDEVDPEPIVKLITEVERPRPNIGSGPPGRAD